VSANRATLAPVDADGLAGEPVVVTGPITGAGLLGIRAGYAAFALWATTPEVTAQIIVVDLADPSRISALGVAPDGAPRIIGADLRP
jgi:hypothetical protein